jgi:hypothetical protein
MKLIGALILLALTYTCGLDSVFWALDQADTSLKAAYEHAAKLYPTHAHSHAQARPEIHRAR